MEAEERAIRNVLYIGMSSTHARDKAINLMNDEEKELTMDFLMQHLEIEDSNSHHKSLSQVDSTALVNFVPYDCRQNKGLKCNKNHKNRKYWVQKPGRNHKSSNSSHTSRKLPDMEGMR